MASQNLPVGWIEATVEDLCEVIGGGTPTTQNGEYWDGGIPWITSADIHAINDIRPRRSITKQGIGVINYKSGAKRLNSGRDPRWARESGNCYRANLL